jgi:hypothetical protein
MDELPGILERLANLADNLELKAAAPLEDAQLTMQHTLYELDALTGRAPVRGVRPWWL